jgi:quinoprotein glucose dehydrogenase
VLKSLERRIHIKFLRQLLKSRRLVLSRLAVAAYVEQLPSRTILLVFPLAYCFGCGCREVNSPRPGVRDWKHYGGDLEGSRYSALNQINRSNVSHLKVAWIYHTGEKRYSVSKTANVSNPHVSPKDISSGKKLFQSICMTCHTPGGQGPDLSRHELKYGRSDAALFRTIFDGIPNSGMPGLYESEDTVWRVVAYVRSLLPIKENQAPKQDQNEQVRLGWKQEARYSVMECTPIAAHGVMYIVTLFSRVQALDAATGKVIWTFDPFKDDQFHGLKRGITYWENGDQKRIYYVGGPRLHCLDAKTGKPISTFGSDGLVELAKGYDREVTYSSYNSPPVIYKNVIILGSSYYSAGEPKMRAGIERKPPPGDIVAYDIDTGKRAWIFHTIPHPGELGYETWPPNAWKTAYGANCWGGMTVDEKRGVVFAGTAAPYYDPPRHGKNLFADTVLALNAETGQLIWHYQTIHHDVWDLDIPCPPNLVTIERNGRKIDAVAQAGKNGLIFVLDRETGVPVFPVEERPVDPGNRPGDQLWPTQPFPVKPPPFVANKFEPTNISPEARTYMLERLKKFRYGRFYEPMVQGGTILYPGGITGGVDYGGASFDPTTGWLYLNSNEIPWIMSGPGGGGQLLDQEGYPAVKPPWGKLSAIDLSKGEIAWQVTLGEYEELTKRGIPPTGTENMGGTIVTQGGLVFVGAAQDAKFRAFDKSDGKLLWEAKLPAVASATPSTYEVNGKQYIVIAAGGGGGMQQVNMLDSAGPFRSHRQRLQPGDAFVAFALP